MVGTRLDASSVEERRDASSVDVRAASSFRSWRSGESTHHWVRCVGKRGAIVRSERDKASALVCEIARGDVVRQVAAGGTMKKDGSTERRVRVLVPTTRLEGWASAKLFIEITDVEADAEDAATDGEFREPASAVAARVCELARRGLERPRRLPGERDARGEPFELAMRAVPLPRPDLGRLRRLPLKVSVVVPTTPNRRWAHRSLYENFLRQAWPNKELVVFETGADPTRYAGEVWQDPERYERRSAEAPSAVPRVAGRNPFWDELGDDRVTYVYAREDAELGVKRNALGEMASGEILVAFDDDDIYLPHYVDAMVHALLRDAAEAPARRLWDPLEAARDDDDDDDDAWVARASEPRLVKLASFACYSAALMKLIGCDLRPPPSERDDRRYEAGLSENDYHGRFWGYGFSYVYTRSAIARAPFPNLTFGEDYLFVREAAFRGCRCAAFLDSAQSPGVLHVLHGESSSMTPTEERGILAGAAEVRRLYGRELAALFGDRQKRALKPELLAQPPAGLGRAALQQSPGAFPQG